MNALAAAAAASVLEFGPATIAAGLARLQPVAGRLMRLPGRSGSILIDDSYNANPGSLKAALEVLVGLPGRPWLVLGDMGELGDNAAKIHAAAGEQARTMGVERLYGVGELSQEAVAAFGTGGEHFASMDGLIERLTREVGADVAVLVKGSRAAGMERAVAALRADAEN